MKSLKCKYSVILIKEWVKLLVRIAYITFDHFYFSFDSLEEQTSLVARARQLIIMTHHSRPVFDTNVRMAYEALQKSKCK